MICFSMESVLVQLGIPLRRRGVLRRESFRLTVPRPFAAHPLFEGIRNPQSVWRSHHWYVPRTAIEGAPAITSVSSYNGEVMIALYKNAVLVQYHPERSKDGRQFLGNWLKGV
jgi:GMP synthase-like glutamine amidotransferase